MKLLLVEDELSLSRAMTAILQKNGYTVDAAYNGREALEYMKADEYDGVILDLMLPEIDLWKESGGITAKWRRASFGFIFHTCARSWPLWRVVSRLKLREMPDILWRRFHDS